MKVDIHKMGSESNKKDTSGLSKSLEQSTFDYTPHFSSPTRMNIREQCIGRFLPQQISRCLLSRLLLTILDVSSHISKLALVIHWKTVVSKIFIEIFVHPQ
uniref:Uncharacterized protein n=2 Tax=Parascaris univalens TaxID=6257 RepID=A0A915C3R6_PARUN